MRTFTFDAEMLAEKEGDKGTSVSHFQFPFSISMAALLAQKNSVFVPNTKPSKLDLPGQF